MRIFLISLAIAFVFCLPAIGQALDMQALRLGILRIPVTGLEYMLTFFHEIGHTLAMWLFGYPAVPHFDFEHGGGMARHWGRSWIVLCAIWFAAAGFAVYLYQHLYYRGIVILGICVAVHVLCVFTRLGDILISFMGQGGEILVGGFCMLRAFWNTTEKSRGAVERWLNMVFGIYAMLSNIIMAAGLMFSDISRMAYAMQKGGHLLGDLDKIAQAIHLPVQAVATVLMLFTLGMLGMVVYLGFRYAPEPAHQRNI